MSIPPNLPPFQNKIPRIDSDAQNASRAESSASTASLARIGQSYNSAGSRKRPRCTDTTEQYETPSLRASSLSHTRKTFSTSTASDLASPIRLVDTTYRLTGSSEPPPANVLSDIDFRRRWDDPATVPYQQSGFPEAIGNLSRTRVNEKKSSQSTFIPTDESWGQYVYNVVGGLAGHGPTLVRRNTDPGSEDTHIDDTWVMASRSSTPMPGEYPKETLSPIDDVFDADDFDYRPSKRVPRSDGDGWLMVNNNTKRRSATPGSVSNRSRKSMLPRGALTRTQFSHHPIPTLNSLSNTSVTGSPYAQKAKSASVASPRSIKPSEENGASPLSAEAQKLISKRERDARLYDASMKKFNQKLKDMIREGQAALSTKFEINDNGFEADFMDEDEDFADEPYEMDRKPW